MSTVRAEFTVEPFNAGQPGKHVLAAVEAVKLRGLDPQVGPFATEISGDDVVVTDALQALTAAALAGGATRISITVERAE